MINKLLLVLGLVMIPVAAYAWDQKPNLPKDACSAQIPWGVPSIDNNRDITIECHTAYVVGYDNKAKIPAWTSYTLTPEHAMGCLPRVNAFATDLNLPLAVRSTPQDYVGSGDDKGHNVNDGDMSWDPQVQNESFLMSNMSPQLPGLNRSTWKELESSVRAWVHELNQPMTIYAGNIYNDSDPTIGINKVVVPHYLYKIVINDVTHQVAGWVFPQDGNLGIDISKFRVSLNSLNRLTNINFSFPPDVIELSTTNNWPVNFGQFTRDKRAICKK